MTTQSMLATCLAVVAVGLLRSRLPLLPVPCPLLTPPTHGQVPGLDLKDLIDKLDPNFLFNISGSTGGRGSETTRQYYTCTNTCTETSTTPLPLKWIICLFVCCTEPGTLSSRRQRSFHNLMWLSSTGTLQNWFFLLLCLYILWLSDMFSPLS